MTTHLPVHPDVARLDALRRRRGMSVVALRDFMLEHAGRLSDRALRRLFRGGVQPHDATVSLIRSAVAALERTGKENE